MENIYKIQDMVEFEPLKATFDEIVASQLIDITSFQKLLTFAK